MKETGEALEGEREGNLAAVRTFQTMPTISLDRFEEG